MLQWFLVSWNDVKLPRRFCIIFFEVSQVCQDLNNRRDDSDENFIVHVWRAKSSLKIILMKGI